MRGTKSCRRGWSELWLHAKKQPSGLRRPALSELLDNTPDITRVSDWDEMHEQLPAYEQDDGPLTKKQIAAIKRMVPQRRMGGTKSLL